MSYQQSLKFSAVWINASFIIGFKRDILFEDNI
jgi:hypothetical protein